jgi:uncharacterized protein (DUF2141 family)
MRRLLIARVPSVLISMLALVLAAAPARAVDVTVQVTTVGSARGVVRAEVCRAIEWLKDGCALTGMAPARPGSTVVVVHGVPPGIYAVVAWHDRNGNGKVDQNWLGIPTEGVGFSIDPALGLKGPRFGDSAVDVGPEGAAVDVHLRFE